MILHEYLAQNYGSKHYLCLVKKSHDIYRVQDIANEEKPKKVSNFIKDIKIFSNFYFPGYNLFNQSHIYCKFLVIRTVLHATQYCDGPIKEINNNIIINIIC